VTGEDNILKLVAADEPQQHEYHLQDQVGFILRRAQQRHVAIFSSCISDLTPPQFAALAKLHEAGATSQNQLGALIAMDAATIKGVIDRLRARGLVELSRHEGDRRRLLVALTGEGRNLVEQLIPLAARITEKTLAPLSSTEARTFLELLARLA
jgi:DNA-binding MarR family transcriptional regulator